MEKTRLKKKLERQTLRNIILTILGIVIIIVLFLTFGIQILINFSLGIEKLRGSQDVSSSNNSSEYVAPPVLDPTFSATNSAQVKITGYTTTKQTLKLYINGRLVTSTSTKPDNTFVFDNVTLDQGNNTIKAKAFTQDGKESDYSNTVTINYSNKTPSLTIDSPQDGQNLGKNDNPLKVTGKTDAGDKVTVNGFWAIVDDNGQYTYMLTLQNGGNDIKVITTDDAGNKTEKDIKVNYSP